MDEQGMLITILLIGVVLGMLLGWALSSGNYSDQDTIELGQAICEEEYDMDFDSYDSRKGHTMYGILAKGELKCKPKVIKEEVEYDGIVIQIGE